MSLHMPFCGGKNACETKAPLFIVAGALMDEALALRRPWGECGSAASSAWHGVGTLVKLMAALFTYVFIYLVIPYRS